MRLDSRFLNSQRSHGRLELAKEMRKLDLSVKIFLITAFEISSLERDPMFQSGGINEVIQKPIMLSDLRNIIQESLQTNN